MMKSITLLTALLAASSSVSAFAPTLHSRTTTSLRMAVELVPEPDGGVELTKISTDVLPGSRMKCMGDSDKIEGAQEFWLSAKADGAAIKKLRTKIEKESSKKANFPGFRKGQIPPWAMPKMVLFAIQEAVIKTCEASLEAYGLSSLEGADGEVTVNEDMQEACKGYKAGSDIEFTATYRGNFDDVAMSAAGIVDEVMGDVVDAEVVDAEIVAE